MFLLHEPIETERLRLRPFRTSDTGDVFAIRSNRDVTRYLATQVDTVDEVGPLLAERAGQVKLAADDDVLVLAAERAEDGRVLGEVTLWLRSARHRQGELGFVFHPDGQGHGYAREAATALLALAFDTLDLHRVYGRTDLRNTGSATLMRRLGMQQEAHLRHNEFFRGEWTDELIFSLLESEWQAQTK